MVHLAFVSDMHLAPFEADAERSQSNLDRPPRRKAHFEAALRDIARHSPEAVLFGGDNANQPVTKDDHCNAALELMRLSPVAWRAIPGNHDVGSCVGWHHHNPEELARACAAFREAFGPDRWTLDAAGFRIIAFNSQIAGADLPEAREQEQWLADQLASACDRPRIAFFHTPLYLTEPDEDFSDGTEMMCLKPGARQPILRALQDHPPDLVITAHAHRFWRAALPFCPWVGLPATALGQHEMKNVPDHRLPAGHDAVAWVSLQRVDSHTPWRFEHHPIELP